jgi:hypothetical protein
MVNSPWVVTKTAWKVSGAMVLRMAVSGMDWEKRGHGDKGTRRQGDRERRRRDLKIVFIIRIFEQFNGFLAELNPYLYQKINSYV